MHFQEVTSSESSGKLLTVSLHLLDLVSCLMVASQMLGIHRVSTKSGVSTRMKKVEREDTVEAANSIQMKNMER